MKNETTCTLRGMRERSVEKQREGGRTYLRTGVEKRNLAPSTRFRKCIIRVIFTYVQSPQVGTLQVYYKFYTPKRIARELDASAKRMIFLRLASVWLASHASPP